MSTKTLFFFLVFMGCLGQFASDIYTPAVPHIAHYLATSSNAVQWTMAAYLFAMSVSILFYGPLSDGIGRKKALYVGIVIMIIGSITCALSTSITMLMVGRVIQGLGTGATGSLWRSIFRDRCSGAEMSKLVSYLGIIVTFIIAVAPIFGGYLNTYISWHAIFWFLSTYSLLVLLATKFLYQETSTTHHINHLKPTFIWQSYRTLLLSKSFMGFALCSFITYGAFFSWFVMSPIILIKHAGLSSIQYGWLSFAAGGVPVMICAYLNGKLVGKIGSKPLLRMGWAITICSGILMVVGNLLFGVHAWNVLIPAVLFYFGINFIWPNVFAGAFEYCGKIAGFAGSLYAFIQLLGGAVFGGIVTHLPDHNQMALGIVFIVLPAIAWGWYEFGVNSSLA